MGTLCFDRSVPMILHVNSQAETLTYVKYFEGIIDKDTDEGSYTSVTAVKTPLKTYTKFEINDGIGLAYLEYTKKNGQKNN